MTRELLRFWNFIDGQYLLDGVDLYALFESLDGERTFNVVDTLIQNDALLGQHLDSGGLEKMRARILRIYKDGEAARPDAMNADLEYSPRGLHSGTLVSETDSGFTGLREAPMA